MAKKTNKPQKQQDAVNDDSKERENYQEQLTKSKDNGQAAATSALFVIQVAALKNVLDGGPDDNMFFWPGLVMIITALLFQILVGLLTIYVCYLRNYYTTNSGTNSTGCWKDICETLCCCSMNSNLGHEFDEEDEVPPEDMVSDSSALVAQSSQQTAQQPEDTSEDSSTDDEETDGKFPRVKNNELKKSLSPGVLTKIARTQTRKELAREATIALDIIQNSNKEQVRRIEKALEAEQKDDEVGERDAADNVDGEDFKPRDAKSELKRLDEENRHIRKKRLQKEVLFQKFAAEWRIYEIKRKTIILKKLSLWQGMINYLLYFIFMLNIFVTGFGVATMAEEYRKKHTVHTSVRSSL